jgi:tRNA threonylcarbamoyladenosine biosynthesis protein TsaB
MAGVSSLHANAARAKDFDGVICSLLDARKSEVYTALFLSAGGRLTRLSDDQLASLERALVQARVKDGAGSPRFVGDGAKVYEKRIAKEFGAGSVIFAGGAVATEVARLGEERLSSRLGDDIGTLIPIYLRPSEAETKLAKNRLTC